MSASALEWRIEVAGIPHGQPRTKSRAMHLGGGKWTSQTYDPKHPNDAWKAAIAHAARERGITPLSGAVGILRMEFRIMRPKGHMGKRGLKPSAPVFPTGKPDLDNMEKSVKDALKGIAWVDDAQVCLVVNKFKRFARLGESAGLTLIIRPLLSIEDHER